MSTTTPPTPRDVDGDADKKACFASSGGRSPSLSKPDAGTPRKVHSHHPSKNPKHLKHQTTEGPQKSAMLIKWSKLPTKAIASRSSSIPQSDVGSFSSNT